MCVVHMLCSQVYGLPLLGQPHYYYYLLITKRHGEQVQRHSQRSGWCRWTVYRAGRRTRRSRNAGTRAAWSRGTAPVPSHRSSAAPGSSRGARTGAVDSSRRPRSSRPQPRTPLAADPTHIVSIYTLNGPSSGNTQVSRYQKGKTNLYFTEARDSEWQWHQLGNMQVCTSLQAARSRQITMVHTWYKIKNRFRSS